MKMKSLIIQVLPSNADTIAAILEQTGDKGQVGLFRRLLKQEADRLKIPMETSYPPNGGARGGATPEKARLMREAKKRYAARKQKSCD